MPNPFACFGYGADPTFQHAVGAFTRVAKCPPLIIDLESSGHGFWVDYEEGGDLCRVKTQATDTVLVRDSLNVYQRMFGFSERISTRTHKHRGHRIAEYVVGRLFDEEFFRTVINPCGSGWSNGVRPIHYHQLSDLGLRIPDWIVTNCSEQASEFIARCDSAVFAKSGSHWRTIARRVVRPLKSELTRLTHAPVLFQRAIEGPEYRIHVVGEECFAVRIDTEADDYRYPGGIAVSFQKAVIPDHIAVQCIRATRELGLIISGIDMRHETPSGEWFCLEVNPMPGYSHYDVHLCDAISAALARVLEAEKL